MKPIKLAVIGSRGFNNFETLETIINHIRATANVKYIVSGGARGADKLGDRYAKYYGLEAIVFLPDWEKHGKAAGFIRNTEIVKEANMVLAMWDGVSKGTEHSMNLAKDMGKPLLVYNYTSKLFYVHK